MRGGSESPVATRVLRALRNVTLLERPAPMRSVLSAVEAAVRSRVRQYQIRDQVELIRRAEATAQQLLASERAARAQAENANRIKDEFLATVSHELRTPLNAILGWSHVLRQVSGDPAEVEAGVDVIERNARLQAQLIEDLLDMSRITSGKIRLDLQPLDCHAIVEPAVESIRPSARAKQIRVEQSIETCGRVLGDAARLQQVFWNLLSNAVKFTPGGGTVTFTCRPAAGAPDTIEFAVTDTGEGIGPQFLPHVFERFRQGDGSTTRRHGGLGLGLAIVKQLVELHGGSVEATSAGQGRGSTFTVRLPLMTPAEIPAPESDRDGARFGAGSGVDGDGVVHGHDGVGGTRPATAARPRRVDLTGVKVLVVDDDADARALVRRILVNCRAEVATAASAPEALDLLAADRPDVLVSDIGMPDMDGYELIRKVRADHHGHRNGNPDHDGHRPLPAIALTAFARAEDRSNALAAGYQSHLAKPVEPAELIAVVASLAGRTAAR
jgi:signal transduction histidine kinase/ActR/RegA family two-component response regulator